MAKTILVVEDEKPLRDIIEEKLKIDKYNVLAVYSVDEALEILRKGVEVDAVWLDHYLPGRSGLELVSYMKDPESKFKDTPIFLVSNSASPERIYQYLQLGVDGYFIKSDRSLEDIISNIGQVINHSK